MNLLFIWLICGVLAATIKILIHFFYTFQDYYGKDFKNDTITLYDLISFILYFVTGPIGIFYIIMTGSLTLMDHAPYITIWKRKNHD